MELWDIYDRHRRTTGRFHVRGTPMGRGEYHLTAFVWVFNRQRELLLTRRAPEKGDIKPITGRHTRRRGLVGDEPADVRRAARETGIEADEAISIWCGAFASTPPSVMSISSSMISCFPRCTCSPARPRRPAGVRWSGVFCSSGEVCSAGCPPPAPAAGRIPKRSECLRLMGPGIFANVTRCLCVGERHAAPGGAGTIRMG